MKDTKNPRIRKAMGYVWFLAFIGWLFMGIGVAFFEYDPGVLTRTVSFLLGAAYFYKLYDETNGGESS